MWGILLGMPLAVIIFLATDHYVMQWDLVGDRFAVDALAACLGLCGYYVARGIDVFLNQKETTRRPLTWGSRYRKCLERSSRRFQRACMDLSHGT